MAAPVERKIYDWTNDEDIGNRPACRVSAGDGCTGARWWWRWRWRGRGGGWGRGGPGGRGLRARGLGRGVHRAVWGGETSGDTTRGVWREPPTAVPERQR